jgi:hypothetical protein
MLQSPDCLFFDLGFFAESERLVAPSKVHDSLEVLKEEGLEQAKPIANRVSANHREHALLLSPNILAGLMRSGVEPAPVAVPWAELFGRAAGGNEYL